MEAGGFAAKQKFNVKKANAVSLSHSKARLDFLSKKCYNFLKIV
jgi:hypothetical protein